MLALAASGGIGLLRPQAGAVLPRVMLPALGALLAGLDLLGGSPSTGLPVPIGFAGSSGGLALDPLAGLFVLLACVAGSVSELSDLASQRALAGSRLLLAAIMLTMLAADLFLLAIAGMLAILLLGRSVTGTVRPRRLVVAAACLAGACTLLAGLATPAGALLPDGGFALLRGSAVEAGIGHAGGLGAVLLPLLALGAAGTLLGLLPWPGWHGRLCEVAPAAVPGLSGLLGLFLLLRLLLDLAGPAPPAWWGMVVILLGLGSALLAGISALDRTRLRAAIGSLLALQNALMVLAIGICLVARSFDLDLLARAGLDAALLLLPMQALSGHAALGLAAAIEAEAGTGLLRRLGGLVHAMPHAATLALVAAAILSFAPPGGLYVGLWLLLQSALGLCRITGLAGSGLGACFVAALLLVAALSVAGWLRLAAMVFLGRPRTPRGAAAQEIPRRLGRVHAALLVPPLLIGLLPGLWLRLIAPLGATLASAADIDPPPLLRLTSPGGGSSLWPLPLALLMLLSVAACVLAIRRSSLPGRPERREPAWDGGFAPPPPWLPFGDPLTQPAPAALIRSLRQALGIGRVVVPGRRMMRRRLRTVLVAAPRSSRSLAAALDGRVLPGLALALLAALLAVLGLWRVA